jgi:hypothetical protein
LREVEVIDLSSITKEYQMGTQTVYALRGVDAMIVANAHLQERKCERVFYR